MNFSLSSALKCASAVFAAAILGCGPDDGLKEFAEGKEAYALFGTKYGAMDHTFEVDGKSVTVPDGIAHFLEHKLFENEDGSDTFSRFAAVSASANAFTSNELTAFLFSATDRYHEALEILLDFVGHPYFTKETVAKEQGIIGQEIRMYDDDPDYQLYFGLLNCLYREHPVKIDIAGTVESIAEITDTTLYDCYRTFYHPKNMALVLCGPFDPEKVEEICDRILPAATPFSLSRTAPEEPKEIAQKNITRRFPVAMGQFAVGLKETELSGSDEALLKRVAAQEVALEICFGRSSDFYDKLYESSLISDTFSYSYQFLDSCAFTILQGESEDVGAVEDAVRKAVRTAKDTALSEEDFRRAQKTVYGGLLLEFNTPSEVASQVLSFHFQGADALRLPEAVARLTAEDITERISHWEEELIASSFILPKEEA